MIFKFFITIIDNSLLLINRVEDFFRNNMSLISDWSAIITCILFLFYIIGHCWTLVKESRFGTASVEIDYERTMDDIDDFDLVADENAGEIVLLKANTNIRQIALFNVKSKNSPIFKRLLLVNDGKSIDYKKMVPAGEIIKIKCVVPEGIPRNRIVIKRNDGIKEEFLLGYDGRMEGNGVAPTNYKVKRTIGAWVYYFLR